MFEIQENRTERVESRVLEFSRSKLDVCSERNFCPFRICKYVNKILNLSDAAKRRCGEAFHRDIAKNEKSEI